MSNPNEVTRFGFDPEYGGWAGKQTDGAYVLYSSYQSLELENKRLEAEAKAARSKTIEEACDAIAKTCEDCGGAGFTIGIGTEAGHGCDGTEESCARNCPIPIQVQIQEPCEICHRFLIPAQEAIRALNKEKE